MSLTPQHHSLSAPAGYAIAKRLQVEKAFRSPLIVKALKDRALLERLCDRVYRIMLADLQQQQDRSRTYGGW